MGMLAMIRAECVKRRKWLTDEEMGIGVALGQLIPGPFVPNYCQYIGHKLRGWRGAAVATGALLLPSFLLMMILSWIYLTYHTLPGVVAVFKGISVVMTAIIIWAAYDMGRVLIRDGKRILIFIFSLTLLWFKIDPVLTVLVGSALMMLFDHVPSRKIFMIAPVFGFDFKKILEIFWIFFKTGAVIFGGGYAAIPFIEKEVCVLRPWLTAQEFLAGIDLGQITPGPVAITATFVGFKVGGLLGAFTATLAIFLPSFLIFQIIIHIYHRVEQNKFIVSFLNGAKSAIVAILFSTGVIFAFNNWHNLPAALFGLIGLVLLMVLNLPPLSLIAAGVVFGLIMG